MRSELSEKSADEKFRDIAIKTVEHKRDDERSREEWKLKRDRWFKLWSLFREPKTSPWPNASNVCIPLLATAVNQFHGRAYQSIFAAPGIVKALPVSRNDVSRAKRVEKYMDWQVLYEMREYEEVFDRLLLNLPINGIAFKKLMYDSNLKRSVSDYISALDLIVPYRTKSLETARRITHRLWLNWDELLDRNEQGLYENFDQLQETSVLDEDKSEQLRQTVDDTVGETANKAIDEPHVILERHSKWDLGDGRKPYIITVDEQSQTLLRMVSREFTAGATTTTLNYFTDYHFIPNPEGFYSFGFGHFLEVLNEMANTAFNQIFDAGRLSNQPFGFFGRRAGFKKKQIELWPGKMIEVEDATQVNFPQVQRLDGSLFQVLGLINDFTAKFTSVTDNLLGREQPGVERPTARGTLALIEQGLTTFGIIVKRVYRSMGKELALLKLQNEIFLPDSKEFRISGDLNKIAFADIKREDFGGVQDIIPVADPAFASKQTRRQEAAQIYQLMLTNPLVIGTPPPKEGGEPAIPPNPRALWQVTSDLLDTFEVPTRDQILPDLPPESIDPDAENAMFMQGDTTTPLADENHQLHLQVHVNFTNTEDFLKLPKEYRQLALDHISVTTVFAQQQLPGGIQ
jgi:hypothetical protein